MNSRHYLAPYHLRPIRRELVRLLQGLVVLATILSPMQPALAPAALAAPASAPAAQTNTLRLNVVSARTESRAFSGAGVSKGAVVASYRYIINIDNTGTTEQRLDPANGALPPACTPADPTYPANCRWTSIAGVPGSSPIFTQGDQSDFTNGMDLPPGRYLVSVLADGYKLDGAHFTVPLETPGVVKVELQPTPLPDATVRAMVFEDNAVTNGAPDVPVEHGLAGFIGHIADYIGEVTTDVYGNPLCTIYQGEDPVTHVIDPDALVAPDYAPEPIAGTGGQCVSDANGELVIPHVGPNRYALSAIPPDGETWIQTTTLEGNHDWDAWVMEGSTGYDTEFVAAGEPFPATFFGFVKPTASLPARRDTGTLKGLIAGTKVYIPTQGGLPVPGTIFGGLSGAKVDKPIDNAWISLADLQNGDTSIYVAAANADGTFTIDNVPAGNYTLTWWDEPQDYILDLVNVTVAANETVDMGVLPLTGWWTAIEGYVFNDLNRNGVRDPGEQGLANFPVALKKRENSLMDRGAVVVTTDADGHYYMENAYPMTQWLVQEAYSDLYYTTGVTFQADNQPTPTTVLGAGVDVSMLLIINLGGRLDWAVHAYAPTGGNGIDPQNGGIVGTVSYDTTRNELDPRYAAVEDWQPGVPNLPIFLYAPVPCGTHANAPCDASGRYELDADGAFTKGTLLNSYVTENWERPKNCVARDVDGNPLHLGSDEAVLPQTANADCLEGPLMSVQFGPYATDQGTPDANFGATVDGNYGFGDGCFGGSLNAADPANPVCPGGFAPLTAGDYIVDVQIPTEGDVYGSAAAHPLRPLYQVTREEDINIFTGDQYVPQIPPPECAGPLHTVDVAGVGADGSAAVDNPNFADAGGSAYEGQPKPLCSAKLVRVSDGRSIAPAFNVFTDVPIPGRFWGLIVDDLNFSSDKRSLLYGEKAGVAFAPVGIYDFTNRLVYTAESDFNGLFDVLLPSTNRISCPTPSGVCANLYRFVGNDPGVPGRLNTNFKPQFRTIAAEFEAFPGLLVPADLAPTQMGVSVQVPGSQFSQLVSCKLEATTPQLFTVSQPYVNGSGSFTIAGQGFGATTGQVLLNNVALPTTSWTNTSIAVNVPATTPAGPHQLAIRAANGESTVNGLTFHVLGVSQFPSNSVPLDPFNRANSNFLGFNWAVDNFDALAVNNNTLRVRTSNNNIRNAWWAAGQAFGTNQEAYFTFTQVSNQAAANEQGLLLKFSVDGFFGNPGSNSAQWIEVAYNNTPANTVRIRTKTSGSNAITDQATLTGVTLAANDQLGARAANDGTIIVYKNGAEIGRTTVAATATWAGRIGIRFEGTGTGTPGTAEARIDNFGGGNAATGGGYQPNVYEVGPGKTYAPGIFDPNGAPSHAIQNALDAAAASPGDDLVVVYPGEVQGDRINPRGAYFENIVMAAPVKLQGVGPGGTYADGTYVPGSIIDGSAYGGDTAVANDWRTLVGGLTWDGDQNAHEAQTIYVLASANATNTPNTARQFTTDFKASIDGLDIRGGDQMGFPTNINVIGGTPTGLPAAVTNQGGAIFANAYARFLQITNNVVENNSGAYGTIRIGTPDIPAPDTNQHNESVRIANNRILLNGGTNLAGGIGLFAGSDFFEVAKNDLCGNFSAEYGGGITVYGYSPNGRIHHNRIYFNQSYDEAGGVMIAGELPANANTLSPGTGPVDIYANLIQNNLANDDGGGLRFLMAGNYPMNVYNNMVVNNVSTHEGGGISINDAPNVRVFNNTIMKNITTATAVTSNGSPAPAGLSSSANSAMLQATLPGGSPTYSNPLLFNNIFADNRAGARSLGTVIGIGAAGDLTPVNNWDLGVANGTAAQLLAPTNTLLQTVLGTLASPTNRVGADPAVAASYTTAVAFSPWRTNPNFVGAVMVAVDAVPSLLGNYHIQIASPAIDGAAASKQTIGAPAVDYDNQARPSGAGYDIGADEFSTAAALPQGFYYALDADPASIGQDTLSSILFLPFVSGTDAPDAATDTSQVDTGGFQLYLPTVTNR